MWHSIGCFLAGAMVGASVVYVWAACVFDVWGDDDWPNG